MVVPMTNEREPLVELTMTKYWRLSQLLLIRTSCDVNPVFQQSLNLIYSPAKVRDIVLRK